MSDPTGRHTSNRTSLLPIWLLLLLVALRLPVVFTPFFEDDLHQLVFLSGAESHPFSFRGPLDLFRFFDGDEVAAQAKIESGVLPWRADGTQRVAFLRPVASALMWLDHSLFGMASVPAHLHSLLWFLLFVLSAGALYRRLLPVSAARIALLACLLTPTSLQAIRWWSARNALLAAFFAAWCISFYLDWWRTGERSRLLASTLCLFGALLSAESALALLAFPLVHALITGSDPSGASRSRVYSGVLCLTALGLAFLGLRSAMGYGVEGSALYVNPFVDPLGYLGAALPRLPQALGIVFLNEAGLSLWVVLPLLMALVWLLLPGHRAGRSRSESDDSGSGLEASLPESRLIAWLAVATLLALTVCFASRSSLRPWTMLVPQLGAHALLGLAIAGGLSSGPKSTGAWRHRVLAGLLAIACLIVPLHRHWTVARTTLRTDTATDRSALFPEDVREAITPSTRRVVLIDSPYQIRTSEGLALIHGIVIEPGTSVLTLTDNPFVGGSGELERTGPSSFVVRADRTLLRRNDLFRYDDRAPLAAGTAVQGDRFRIEVTVAPGGLVREIAVTLGMDLDDPELVLLRWNGETFGRLESLSEGDSIRWP